MEKGAVLFWDEPEANINPTHIPIIADMLLALQRSGVQIFIATHDYILAKYIETRALKTDNVQYFSLYDGSDTVCCDTASQFSSLEHNPIVSAFDSLLDEVYNNKVNGNEE